MRNITRRAGVAGSTTCAVATALTLVMAGPAWAESQWANCYQGQTGWTRWKETDGTDSITPFHGIWENPNGDLVDSEWQYIGIKGNTKFRIYGEGDAYWAFRGVFLETTHATGIGTKCEGPDTSVLLAPLADSGAPLDTLGAVPPLPKLAFVIEPENVAS